MPDGVVDSQIAVSERQIERVAGRHDHLFDPAQLLEKRGPARPVRHAFGIQDAPVRHLARAALHPRRLVVSLNGFVQFAEREIALGANELCDGHLAFTQGCHCPSRSPSFPSLSAATGDARGARR